MFHAINSDDDERNAEPLAHIQHHTVLEGFLAGFQKLDEEAEGEDGGEAIAEIEAGTQRGFVLFVQQQPHDEDQKVGDGFVKLCRMTGLHILVRKDESLGNMGHCAHYLTVHQVAQTDETACQRGADGNIIQYGEEFQLYAA